jgi:diguanylate cyclase (GGDEF)-like protein
MLSADERARLSEILDDLEFHRAFGVEGRLKRAVSIQAQARAAGATDLQMRGRLVEADMRLRLGKVADAARLATSANHWAQEHGPAALQARSHLILSSVFQSVGDHAACLDHALQGLQLLDDRTPGRVRGNFLLRLADGLAVAGSIGAARERYREAEQVFRAIGDTERQIGALNNLAYAECEAAEPRRAAEVAQEMRDLAGATGFVMSAPLLDTLARTHMGMGEYEQAEAVLGEALGLSGEGGGVEAEAPAGLMLTLAEVQLRLGRLELAQATIDGCLAICAERNLGGIRLEALRVQAELHVSAGRFREAYEVHKVFHAEFVQLNSARRQADARTRQALFETAEARHSAQRFWRQARTDALTGLPNRRFVDEEIPRYLAKMPGGGSLAVAIVDADHFKRINDTLSHQVGDRAISELGRVLQEGVIAGTDTSSSAPRLVARLGGEEFLVILPGLDATAAYTLLQGLCDRVANHGWGPLLGKLALTVSVGACAAEPDDTQALLLARADRNLYLAKAAGRNRVVAGEPDLGRSSAARLGCSPVEDSGAPRRQGRVAPGAKSTTAAGPGRAARARRRTSLVGGSTTPKR